MPTLGDFDRHGEIETTVRRIFQNLVCQTRNDPTLDELDEELLRQAAENQTAILLLTSLWKYAGSLTPQQAEGYILATKIVNACLAGLKISNPYGEGAAN
jgi:hypothetical protein